MSLIAQRGRTIAFVEVKWRKHAADLDTAIDEYRLRRVAVAAEQLCHRYARPGDDVRIDVDAACARTLAAPLANVWMAMK
ncbi:MAG: YraN family protein [Sphingopyxis sp.]|nr:YraN family protein [Sphingopyxis sp.]